MIKLSSIGIEEVEASICEDTKEHRRILREHNLKYKLYGVKYLEVDTQDPDERLASMVDKHQLELLNPKNPFGEYAPFLELPLDFWDRAPMWMIRLLHQYNDAVEAGTPEEKLPALPARCRRMRGDGSRCWSWSWPGKAAEGYCRFHAPIGSFDYGAQFQKLTDAAKVRLVEMQGDALDALEDLVSSSSTVPAVRLRAAENILDRTGLAAKQELQISGSVQHEVVDPAAAVRQRLSDLSTRLAPKSLPPTEFTEPTELESEVVDAEIIEDNQEPETNAPF